MSHTDPISDMLTRIKNAAMRKKESVEMPSSIIKTELARMMKRGGFISDYELTAKDQKNTLTVYLKYIRNRSAFSGMKRLSKPGQRYYAKKEQVVRTLRAKQTVLVSTSLGLMTASEAKTKNVGGELICAIW